MAEVSIGEAIQHGLRAFDSQGRNLPHCTQYRNLKPEGPMAVFCTKGLGGPKSEAFLTMLGAESIALNPPFPQFFRGRFASYLGTPGELFEVDESDWSLTPIEPLDIADVTTPTAPTGTGRWEMADFGPVVVFVNGSCMVFHMDVGEGTTQWYVDTTLGVNSAVNFKGRLLLGGFQSHTTHPDLINYYSWLRRENTGLPDLATLTHRHVWWSTIGAEDLLLYVKPDLVLVGRVDAGIPTWPEVVEDNDFELPEAWTMGTGWSIAGEEATKAPGTTSTLSKPIAAEGGKLWRVGLDCSSYTAGAFRVRVGDSASPWHASEGTFVAYIHHQGGDNPSIHIEGDAACDASFDFLGCWEVEETRMDELVLTNQAGHQAMPWQGGVNFLRGFGEYVMVFGEDKVSYLSHVSEPSMNTPTLGLTVLLDEGCQAAGGDNNYLWMVDNNHILYQFVLESNLPMVQRYPQTVRLGREEYLLDIGAPFTINFNPDRVEAYISGAGGTLIATPQGIGFMDAYVAAVAQVGEEVVWLHAPGDLSTWTLETDTLDMGTRLSKTLQHAEVQGNAQSLRLVIKTRNGPNTSWQTKVMPVRNSGLLSLGLSGMDIRIQVSGRAADPEDTLQDVNLTFETLGKKNLSGLTRS